MRSPQPEKPIRRHRCLHMLVLVIACAAGCERDSKPDEGARASATDPEKPTTAGPAVAEARNEPARAESVPPPKLTVHAGLEGGQLRIAIENHDNRLVSLAAAGELTGADAPRTAVDLSGQCDKPSPDHCRPLAPGAALWLSPLKRYAGDGTCAPVEPGRYQLQLTECGSGSTVTADVTVE